MNNDEIGKDDQISLDSNDIRKHAGERLDNTVIDEKSGVIPLNEGGSMGIDIEYFNNKKKKKD